MSACGAPAAVDAYGLPPLPALPEPLDGMWSATLAGLWFFHATVGLPGRTFVELELMLAALRLAALLHRRIGDPARARAWFALLEAQALLVAGFASLGFTFHRLEWGFAYQLFDAVTVERHAFLLAPFILARYLVPLWLARSVLAQARPAEVASTWDASAAALALKLGTLLPVVMGVALFDAHGEPLREAAQQVLALSLLGLGLAHEPRGALSSRSDRGG